MRRLVQRLRKPQEQRGMTIVEVVTTVVVMGLIIAPLTMTLTQALTLIPAASERQVRTSDADYLLATLSHDVTNSTLGVNFVTGATWSTAVYIGPSSLGFTTSPSTGLIVCPASNTTKQFATFYWDDKGVAPPAAPTQYWAEWQMQYTTATGGLMRAQLQRRLRVGTVQGPWSTVYENSCKAGDGSILFLTADQGTTETIDLYVIGRDRKGVNVPNLRMQAAMRTYAA